MTRVEMIYDRNVIMGFRMEGHACFNMNGPDILCASLSATSQMTINGVLDWTGLSLEDILLNEDKSKAILHVEVPDTLHSTTTVQQLFKSFEMYVEMLEEVYEGFVKVERRYKDDL